MNHYALRLFVRSLISEAKDKKAEEKTKKPVKKVEKPKEKKVKSGNLVEMKKELADLKDKLAKIDDTIEDWESIKNAANNMSYGGEQDIEIGADKQEEILKDCDTTIERLKKEKENIEKQINSLQESTLFEINKIKEMMGLVAPKKKGAKKMMGEKDDKPKLPPAPSHEETDANQVYEARYNTSANSKEAQYLKKGDIITSGDEVISVSSGAKTPSGKVEVTLKTKDGKTKTSVWGKTTKVGVKK